MEMMQHISTHINARNASAVHTNEPVSRVGVHRTREKITCGFSTYDVIARIESVKD